jgi:hypothetical protein
MFILGSANTPNKTTPLSLSVVGLIKVTRGGLGGLHVITFAASLMAEHLVVCLHCGSNRWLALKPWHRIKHAEKQLAAASIIQRANLANSNTPAKRNLDRNACKNQISILSVVGGTSYGSRKIMRSHEVLQAAFEHTLKHLSVLTSWINLHRHDPGSRTTKNHMNVYFGECLHTLQNQPPLYYPLWALLRLRSLGGGLGGLHVN